MFVTALLLGLVGVFCILDSRILGRMNFERPLITCTIVGALLGDLQTGLTLGASIELMSLGIVNIGAAAPPDMNMAAIICAAFAILTDASAETELALAIPFASRNPSLAIWVTTLGIGFGSGLLVGCINVLFVVPAGKNYRWRQVALALLPTLFISVPIYSLARLITG